jgi:hypothetical protein
MPVIGNPPPPLRDALESMEGSVQDLKKRLPYLAPEVMDEHWALLQNELAEAMTTLYEEAMTS